MYEATKSIRAVARELGISRKTVKAYVNEYVAARSQGDEALAAWLVSEPRYKTPVRAKTALTGPVRELLDEWCAWRTESVKRRVFFVLNKRKEKEAQEKAKAKTSTSSKSSSTKKSSTKKSSTQKTIEKTINTTASSFGRTLGNQIARSILGGMFKKK